MGGCRGAVGLREMAGSELRGGPCGPQLEILCLNRNEELLRPLYVSRRAVILQRS